MTGLGTPPPAELGGDRAAIAAWYAERVRAEDETHRVADDEPCTCPVMQDLISGAIGAGVHAVDVPVDGGRRKVPLHALLAPYRRRPGGLQEQAERRLVAVLALERPRGRLLGRTEQREWIP